MDDFLSNVGQSVGQAGYDHQRLPVLASQPRLHARQQVESQLQAIEVPPVHMAAALRISVCSISRAAMIR